MYSAKYKGNPMPLKDRFSLEQLRQLFIDRKREIDAFEQKLRQPPPIPVLTFFGVGGVGKTYLLRYLYYQYGCCWQEPPRGYPHAFLSFPRGHLSISAPEALWQAREQLRRYTSDFTFTRFDLLWGKLWERTYQLPIHSNRMLVTDELSWLTELLQSTEQIPLIGDVTKALRLFHSLTQRVQQTLAIHSVLDWFKEHVETPTGMGWKAALQTMELAELAALLPRAFAVDLADSTFRLNIACNRVLIFVDNYETLQEHLGEFYGKETSSFIQVLAEELVQLKANVLLIVAGRDSLRWAKVRRRDGTWTIDPTSLWAQGVIRNNTDSFVSKFLEQYLVGDLSEADSMEYLLQRRSLTPELAQEIYEPTRGYPLALGIAADLVQEAGVTVPADLAALRARTSKYALFSQEWREELNNWLLERLLEQLTLNRRESLKSIVRVAAIPRWFNEDLLLHLTDSYDLQDQFDQLIRYSFVEPYEVMGQRVYRLHALTRKLLRQGIRSPAQKRKWEETAMQWFDMRVDKASVSEEERYQLEALYHFWHLEWHSAINRLKELFDKAYPGQVALCWELLDTTSEVINELPAEARARLKLYEAYLYAVPTPKYGVPGKYYELALHSAREAMILAEGTTDEALKAEAYLRVAKSLNLLQRFTKSLGILKKACEAAEKVDDNVILAEGLRTLASVETGANPDYGNFSILDQALDLFKQPEHTRHKVGILHIKAWLAMRLGKWTVVEQALREEEQLCLTLQDKSQMADVLLVWGEYYSQRERWEKAAEYLGRARQTFHELEHHRGICASTGWLGIALCHLGNLQRGLDLVRDALRIERDILGSREGASKWLHCLGELFFKRDDMERALHALWLSQQLREELRHAELHKTMEKIEEVRLKIGDHAYTCLEAEFHPRRNEFGEYAFLWGLNQFRKYSGNPVLESRGDSWESHAVFNPAAWTDGEKVYLLYRAEERPFTSRIGFATSTDGIHFNREPTSVFEATEPYEIPGGCEDPRVVFIDGIFYMTYTAYDGETARLAMAVSRDLHNWEKRGPLFPERNWTKAGAILPQPINGFYWMYFGDTHIWAAYSEDLKRWEVIEEPVLSPRDGYFDSHLVEPGPPPLITPEGILLIYNSANDKHRYSIGQCLFALDDPKRLLRRSPRPLLEPTTAPEKEGQLPQVVFGGGLVQFNGKWFLYYGMADACIGVAVSAPELQFGFRLT